MAIPRYPPEWARFVDLPQGCFSTSHRYGSSAEQVADLLVPHAPGPHPTAVLIHGGFWRLPWDRRLMNALGGDLLSRGWAVWNIEYRRLGSTGGGWPGTLEDVAAAVDALVESPRGVHLDLDRVVAIGHSAGGHLALWLGCRPGLPLGAVGASPRFPIAAAVALAGVADLRTASAARLGGGAVAELLGGLPDQQSERCQLASPRERLPLGIPQLLAHGSADDVVPSAMSEEYARAAQAAGDAAVAVIVPGEDHMAVLDPLSVAWSEATTWLERFTH